MHMIQDHPRKHPCITTTVYKTTDSCAKETAKCLMFTCTTCGGCACGDLSSCPLGKAEIGFNNIGRENCSVSFPACIVSVNNHLHTYHLRKTDVRSHKAWYHYHGRVKVETTTQQLSGLISRHVRVQGGLHIDRLCEL